MTVKLPESNLYWTTNREFWVSEIDPIISVYAGCRDYSGSTKWLLRMIAKKGVPFLRAIFLRLVKGTMPRRFWLLLAANRVGAGLNDSLGTRSMWLLAA